MTRFEKYKKELTLKDDVKNVIEQLEREEN